MEEATAPDSVSSLVPVGLIGIGLIGTVIAERLLLSRHSVVGWDISVDRREALRLLRGSVATGVNEVFARCDRIILSLPSHDIVAQVLNDATDALRPGQFVIDTSTGDPEAAAVQSAALSNRGIEYLDATISGSSAQLRSLDAVFLVGASEAAFAACLDLFNCLSRKVFPTGPAGSGARMKLVTNLVLGLNRAALAEGLCFARVLGLDPSLALDLMRESIAYSRIMDTKGEKMLRGDFSPQARLSQHLKDVRLILGAANRANAGLPLTETHLLLLEQAEQMGLGPLDNSAIVKVIEGLRSPAAGC